MERERKDGREEEREEERRTVSEREGGREREREGREREGEERQSIHTVRHNQIYDGLSSKFHIVIVQL